MSLDTEHHRLRYSPLSQLWLACAFILAGMVFAAPAAWILKLSTGGRYLVGADILSVIGTIALLARGLERMVVLVRKQLRAKAISWLHLASAPILTLGFGLYLQLPMSHVLARWEQTRIAERLTFAPVAPELRDLADPVALQLSAYRCQLQYRPMKRDAILNCLRDGASP